MCVCEWVERENKKFISKEAAYQTPKHALFACVSVCLLSVCLSVCCLSVCLSVCVSVCLSVCLSICSSVRPSACPPVCLSVRLSVCLYICLSVCLSVCHIIAPCSRSLPYTHYSKTGHCVKLSMLKVALIWLVSSPDTLFTEYHEHRSRWEMYTAGPTWAVFPWKRILTCQKSQIYRAWNPS